ncbi:MAG TPA: pyridoxal-phosphate dependent enzyme [Ktedonobacterales bacterium]|jgi:threonine dehydratase|nr:pyridoxal-phosphate dependent enzyme [Ktedonobacterales bacterium]
MATDATAADQDAGKLAITIDDVRAAAERLRGVAHRTPVMRATSLDEAAGAQVWLKCEQFQRAGAFKFRGAYNKIANLSDEQRTRGVIAFSSGNHAQAVALCGKLFGAPTVICMPTDAPSVKVAATAGYGAEIVRYDRMTQDREALARQIAEERSLTLVPPYNDPLIMAGAGTAALELLEDQPDVEVIATPVGGGGLVSGTSVAARAAGRGVHVVGVETEAANHAYLSKRSGERVTIAPPDTIADGIRTAALGQLTWPVVRELVDEVVLVSDEEVKAAMRFLLMRLKIVAEPTGAVAVAAAMTGKLNRFGQRIGVVISGGNVAPETLSEILIER